MDQGAFARLEGRNFEFYITKRRTVIGRNSKLGDVDVNMGTSRFISRRHLEIVLDRNSFYVLCKGKNGIFVDDTFQRRENKRLQIPNSCIIRFPSTQIKLAFTSLVEDLPLQPMRSPALPLKADLPLSSPFVSPMPSPTGTISAVNSCPVSPESSFRHRVPSFDLKAMAKYASKLLSTQEQAGSDNESAPEAPLAAPNETGEAPTEAMPPVEDEEEMPGTEEEDSTVKPPYSYAQLIVQALLASTDHRQTLSGIYSFISDKYPYYKIDEKGWKNSIRHNLSLNQYFMKAPREKEGLGFGKGGYWCMHPEYKDKLSSQAYVKRKKKGIPVFPSAGLMSRSAPPSPTHHHPMMHTEFSFKDMESKFHISTPPTTSHFTLPSFFSQLPGGTSSTHSLPASPSRQSGFTATPLKYFPVPLKAADDMAMLKKSHKYETIQEEQDVIPPPAKRVRIDERSLHENKSEQRGVPLPALPPGQHNLQFLSIPMMGPNALAPTRTQGLLAQPLSSFLPQNFFSPRAATNQNNREGGHGNES